MSLAAFEQSAARKITAPLVPVLNSVHAAPDVLTWTGLGISAIAAAAIALDYLIAGGLLVLFSGLFDILDGAVARSTNRTTRFGAVLDSTFDRLSEALVLFGVLFLYAGSGGTAEVLLVFAALVGSFLTSYIRARAEGLGMACRVGLFTRAGRVIILSAGLLVNQVLPALVILAIFSFVTVVQRLVYVWREAGIPTGRE